MFLVLNKVDVKEKPILCNSKADKPNCQTYLKTDIVGNVLMCVCVCMCVCV